MWLSFCIFLLYTFDYNNTFCLNRYIYWFSICSFSNLKWKIGASCFLRSRLLHVTTYPIENNFFLLQISINRLSTSSPYLKTMLSSAIFVFTPFSHVWITRIITLIFSNIFIFTDKTHIYPYVNWNKDFSRQIHLFLLYWISNLVIKKKEIR